MSVHNRMAGPGSRSRLRIALAALVAAGAGCAWAATSTETFRVSVKLAREAQCSRSTNALGTGIQVNVSCNAPAESSDRFLLHVYRAGEWLGQVEADTGVGTVTSWRVVHIANRDYLELTVGW